MSEPLGCQYVAAGLWEMAAAPPSALQEFESQLLAKLREATDFDFDNYVDPRDAFYDADSGEQWLPVGSDATDSTWPSFRTDEELRQVRQECRQLALTNEFAINGHENRISYIVGTGHKYQAVARKGVTVSDSDLAAVNRELEDFCRRNRWSSRQQEIVKRFDRDGEVFLRFFERRVDDSVIGYSYSADGKGAASLPGVSGRTIYVRFVEPGQVKKPDNAEENMTLGVETEPDDVETVLAYWIDGERVPAEEIQHRKANVDANVKRGIPLFFPVRKNLKRAEKLLRNITTTAGLQSAIGLIRKHRNVPGSSVRTWANAAADVTVSNRDSGTTTRHKAYQPGSILDTSANTDYEFPAASVNVERFVAGVQAELRAIAARLVMPEFMFTSDASNANYSSTLVSEGPSDKMFQRAQATQEAFDMEVIDRVLDLAAEEGRLSTDWRGMVTIDVHKPRVQVRDEKAEVETMDIEKKANTLSPQSWCAARGRDYEQEMENILAHREKYGDLDLDPNAVYATDAKEKQAAAAGKKSGGAVKEALLQTIAACESPTEFLAALSEAASGTR